MRESKGPSLCMSGILITFQPIPWGPAWQHSNVPQTHKLQLCSRLPRCICLGRICPFGPEQGFMFYRTTPENIMKTWLGNLPVALETRLTHIVQTEMRIIGVKEHKRLQWSECFKTSRQNNLRRPLGTCHESCWVHYRELNICFLS